MLQFNVSNLNAEVATRTTDLITITNGNVYICDAVTYGGNTPSFQLASGGQNAVNPVVTPQLCFADNFCFIVDGTNFLSLDLDAEQVSPFVATVGSTPANFQLCCVWRGSLVLARQTGQEQLWMMSRIGAYTDWGFNSNVTDTARPVSGVSGAYYGKIGDPIIALIPVSDNILYFGCQDQMFAFVGDPRAGGVLDHFLTDCGILGPNAWALDTIGTLYWLSASGLQRLAKGYTIPQNISQSVIPGYFLGLTREGYTFSLVWYEDVHQLHIYATQVGTQSLHMFWEERTGGFFPQSFLTVGLSAVLHGPALCHPLRRRHTTGPIRAAGWARRIYSRLPGHTHRQHIGPGRWQSEYRGQRPTAGGSSN